MIFLLPTRAKRRYRGKYPERVNSWGTSRSSSQQVISDCLGIGRVVHVELNDGRRYILDMKALQPDKLRLNVELTSCLNPDVLFVESEWQELGWERYNDMLGKVQARREADKALRS